MKFKTKKIKKLCWHPRLYHMGRIFLGVVFFVMGINGIFRIIVMEPQTQEGKAFIDALSHAQYFWPLEKLLEVIFGFLLLINRWVPLAIEGLLPIIVNILFFHLFLDTNGLVLALCLSATELYFLCYFWKSCFSHLLKIRH